jgi:hypothetical protein
MSQEQRRSRRKPIDGIIQVVNAMTGNVIGRVGNLSVDGMMLIANTEIRDDALYQFVFHLPDAQGRGLSIEVGVHEQWTEAASSPGQWWAGFRIVDIAGKDFEALKGFVDRSEAH